jgi:hypothetical protein
MLSQSTWRYLPAKSCPNAASSRQKYVAAVSMAFSGATVRRKQKGMLR